MTDEVDLEALNRIIKTVLKYKPKKSAGKQKIKMKKVQKRLKAKAASKK